ncbi:hypothetical protein SAMN04487762_2768 [Polaribacter sp. Hel1_33_78]|nr:hypothetical protein SAMN04487762_2768 [Polaribacter sp. Hel1_33_78]
MLIYYIDFHATIFIVLLQDCKKDVYLHPQFHLERAKNKYKYAKLIVCTQS